MTIDEGLEIRDVTVRYGGLEAVSGVSLEAPIGRLTGLIGPNGAGKTSLFDACTGWTSLSGGSVRLKGADISSRSPSERARLGLGRTFQTMELFDGLSVAENVALGREAAMAGKRVLGQLLTTRAERAQIELATEEALDRCDLGRLRRRMAGDLSTGHRRLVELARALAGSFDLLMLDEPSSGLDLKETERFGEILIEVMKSRQLGILLVEHDMSLVMNICQYIYVVDFGKLIFEGTAKDVSGSEIVQSAYLGVEEG